MSEARRTARNLEAALDHVTVAVYAAGQHRHRTSGTFPQHISDLNDLCAATETLHYITHKLAKLVTSLADDARANYYHGHSPDDRPWPDTVTRAAANADQSLSHLRDYLDKTPVHDSHNALSILHAVVRTTHRNRKNR